MTRLRSPYINITFSTWNPYCLPIYRTPNCFTRRANMLDILFVAAAVAFFVLGALFVRACDHL